MAEKLSETSIPEYPLVLASESEGRNKVPEDRKVCEEGSKHLDEDLKTEETGTLEDLEESDDPESLTGSEKTEAPTEAPNNLEVSESPPY